MSLFSRHVIAAVTLATTLALVGMPVQAARLDVRVQGPAGPAAEAVVSLHSAQATQALKPSEAVIDQRNTQFTPRVSVIETGSRVRFPNSDNVRHQVYSFSPAKTFQLPLYSGKAAAPVVFDKPGVIELGCNIHDWMVAYVVVVDSPWHAITDARGAATLDVPPGRYRLRVWHPELPAEAPPYEEDIEIGDQAQTHAVKLQLASQIEKAAPADDKLRALQEKFRKLKRAD